MLLLQFIHLSVRITSSCVFFGNPILQSLRHLVFLTRQWFELSEGMFAMQILQLYSTASQHSRYFESALVCLSPRHYFRPERQPHTHHGSAQTRLAFLDPAHAPQRAFKHARESVAAYDRRTEHQSFAVQ